MDESEWEKCERAGWVLALAFGANLEAVEIEVTLEAVAAADERLATLSSNELRDALETLTKAKLVQLVAPGRWRLTDLGKAARLTTNPPGAVAEALAGTFRPPSDD